MQLMEQLSKFVPNGPGVRLWLAGMDYGHVPTQAELAKRLPKMALTTSKMIRRAEVHIGGDHNFSVVFHRQITMFQNGHPHSESSDFEAEVFTVNRSSDPAITVGVARAIDEWRTALAGAAVTKNARSTEPNKLAALQLAQLTELHTKILVDAEDARLKAQEEFDARRTNLEEELSTRRSALEAEIDQLRASVLVDRDALAAREKALDDRSHMHVRRELRDQITAALKARLEEPATPKGTGVTRWVILGICAIGALGFGGMASLSAVELHQTLSASSAPSSLLVLITTGRLSLALLAAAGFIFYALGWLRRLHAEDVRAQRDLERYRYDLDRASWAIETILEVQHKQAGEVPSRWIEGVTHALFARLDDRSGEATALDGLAELLNVAAKARIGPAGAELEINRNGLKQVAREAS